MVVTGVVLLHLLVDYLSLCPLLCGAASDSEFGLSKLD